MRTTMKIRKYGIALLLSLLATNVSAQVSFERILNAEDEPENWLTYNGGYKSQRYSKLDQITPENVSDLKLQWTLQNQVFGAWQSNPIVADGIMYITERPNSVMAVDAITGGYSGSTGTFLRTIPWFAAGRTIAA